MGLFLGPRRGEKRAAQILYPYAPMYIGGPSYADVNVSTLESSLQSVAVHSAVDLIASLVSELPVDVFTGTGVNRRPAPRPPALDDPAGDGYGRQDWVYKALTSWLLRGNLFGDILARSGRALGQVDLFHPDQVRPVIQDGAVKWFANGTEVPEGQMLHLRVNSVPGVLLGLSPIQQHAADMGLNITLTRFGLDYFQGGAQPGSVLRNTEKEVGETLARQVKDRFMAAVRGSREPAVMGRGWEFSTIPVNPEESQFLQTRGFSAAECARIFGPGIAEILGYAEAGGTLTYANLQDREVHVLVFSFGRWIRRVDRLLSRFCPPGVYVRSNRDALLETTTLTRYQAHASALGNVAWKTPDEVRRLEDMPPIAGGNVLPGSTPAADNPTPPPAQED